MPPSLHCLIAACRTPNLAGVRRALAAGIDPNAKDEDGCPAAIACLYAQHTRGDFEDLRMRADILRALFAAGADPNAAWDEKDADWAQWPPEPGDAPHTGLQIAIEQCLLPGSDRTWDLTAGLAILEAWLQAGANPDPEVAACSETTRLERCVSWKLHDLLGNQDRQGHIGIANTQAATAGLVLLAQYGCLLTADRLGCCCLQPEQREQVLGAVVEYLCRSLEEKTAPATGSARAARL